MAYNDNMAMKMLPTFLFIIFISFPSVILSYDLVKLHLPSTTSGPEALAFDRAGLGPYTGVSDGRVLKYINPQVGFADFAITSPNRSKLLCDGSNNPLLEPICGRPLGLEFNLKTGNLYIADAYYGLEVVGPYGGTATQLATSAEGVPFKFLNALVIDQQTGVVYFIDSSAKYRRSEFSVALAAGDRTGRLMKYDPRSKEVTVLQKNLGLPFGVAISKDGQYVVYTEGVGRRAQRYWLKGSKANSSEVFATFTGIPDNIKRNSKGEFWVALFLANGIRSESMGQRLSEDGRVLQTLSLSVGNPSIQYSEVQEYRGKIYLGSVMPTVNYVGIICLTN